MFRDESWKLIYFFGQKVQGYQYWRGSLHSCECSLLLSSSCLSNAILTDYLITLVSVRVCPPIGCQTITSAILYRFSRNFACSSEMWLFRTLLFLEQTGSSLPILEMCKIQFWQFRYCGGHIFLRIVIKT